MSTNRLVIAVLILLGSFNHLAKAASEPVTGVAAPTTQPIFGDIDPGEILRLSANIFRVHDVPEISTAALEEAREQERDTVVIPFPTTFWTGFTTLLAMASVYAKRRLCR